MKTMDEVQSISSKSVINIPEDPSRLITCAGSHYDIDQISQNLKDDNVVLIPDVEIDQVDKLVCDIADFFGLKGSLEIQSAFASSLGHRKNIGKYFMSVNERKDYHVVPPHSEGSTLANMQLASFYCSENTTDGGETILLNIDKDSAVWASLRELVKRGEFDIAPNAGQLAKARALYRVNFPEGALRDDDKVLRQTRVDTNLTVIDALAKLQKAKSCVTGEEHFVFWDSICAADNDSLRFMEKLLRQEGLFKEPPNYKGIEQIDWDPGRRVRNSGINYQELYKCKIVRKLKPKEFIIQNNFTWNHAVNNWTPGSGERVVAAAFA